MHHVRPTAAAPVPSVRSPQCTTYPKLIAVLPSAGAAPDRCLTYEFRSDTTTEGERNRFYPTATFADRETRESVIAHTCHRMALVPCKRPTHSSLHGGVVTESVSDLASQ